MKEGGTGGSHTNSNGLRFENNTDLATHIDNNPNYILTKYKFKTPMNKLPKKSSSPIYNVIRRKDNKRIGVVTKQNQFYSALFDLYGLKNANHKFWKPDEAFFNLETNTIFIVEKKWQKVAGSVDEKIFGFVNKRRLYQNDFNQIEKEPKPTVEFCALFNSSWWLDGNNGKNNVNYQDYFNNLRIDGIKIFFDKYQDWWFGL